MPTVVDRFISVTPTTENYLRGVVLFGRNVASYKFALAKSLLELSDGTREVVPLGELAGPYSRHICDHLRSAPRQATSSSSQFLEACRKFNDGDLSAEALRDETVRRGFNNVIDAFHVVGPGDIPVRFFVDERRSSTPGVRLTDALVELAAKGTSQALAEIEARWRLVETAWSLDISRSLIAFDEGTGLLVPVARRVALTSARDALNGYQKGACFYCYNPISTVSNVVGVADVDHLFPWRLQQLGIVPNLDQVWNLVLSCQGCNRGARGKFDLTPDLGYVARLERRNEYLVASHHPLRETLIAQTGDDTADRHGFLQAMYEASVSHQVAVWKAPVAGDPTF